MMTVVRVLGCVSRRVHPPRVSGRRPGGGVVVDKLSAGIHGDLVDQLLPHTEGLGGGNHAHPINRQATYGSIGSPSE